MYKGVISVHWHVNLKQKEEIHPEIIAQGDRPRVRFLTILLG